MQTFLPYPSFTASVAVLDPKRLGKQRVEAYQILRALTGRPSRWLSHPAVQMWRGYEGALAQYMDACIHEWVRRGYRNTMRVTGARGRKPHWFGDSQFHASHRSNLLRKHPTWYGAFGWQETPNLPYVWPIRSAYLVA